MKKQVRKMVSGLLVVGLLVTGLTTGVTVYASNIGTGASGALEDKEYTVEEMLVYAIEDEYLAQTEYEVIMDTYGTVKPFSNIVKAESVHIGLLEPLFEEYKISIPEKDWKSMVAVPESLEEAYIIGVDAEEKNISMYQSFLKEEIPNDVRNVFEELMNASEKHLAAFQRQVDGEVGGNRNGNGSGNGTGTGLGNEMQAGKGKNSVGGTGKENRNTSQCLN